MATTKFLDNTGLAYFWSKIKAWVNATFAVISHTHASSDVTVMTNYSKPNSTSAIAATDTLNQAIGKLEKAIDDADISNVVHLTDTIPITNGGTGATTAIAAMNAIGSGEYYSSGSYDLDDFRQTGIYTFTSGTTITNIPSGSNGTLIVFGTGNSGISRQLWIRTGTLNSNDHNFYFRSYVSSTWSNWHKVYTDSDTIPIANGGTGSTTKNFVDLSTAQDFNGDKYNLNHFGSYGSHPNYEMVSSNITKGSAPSSNSYGSIVFSDKNSKGSYNSKYRIAAVEMTLSTGKTASLQLLVYDQVANATTGAGAIMVTDGSSYNFRPNTNDYITLGSFNYKWKQIFAMTATISTSDERLKSEIGSIGGELLDAWEDVELCTFKFSSSIVEKGLGSARVHSGVVAQRVRDALAVHGVDASRYGFFCYDAWDAEDEDLDEYENVRNSAKSAGDQYSIRYEELLCIEAAYMRRENARLKKRLAALEERLAALEAENPK